MGWRRCDAQTSSALVKFPTGSGVGLFGLSVTTDAGPGGIFRGGAAMARGRMLNTTISYDAKVAKLGNELGGWATTIFAFMIAHLDRDGRIIGDPEEIKGLVTPLLHGVDIETVRETLRLAHKLGLISIYEVEDKAIIEFPKFRKNQANMRYDREGQSKFPPNSKVVPSWVEATPEYSGVTPANSGVLRQK